MVVKTQMSCIDFVVELKGYIDSYTAYEIFKMIENRSEDKKNIVLDTLKANPEKYVKFYLQDDI